MPGLREWVLAPFARMKERRKAQQVAESFWKSCANAAVGSAELYRTQQEQIERMLVPHLRQEHVLLDIGCGDGGFTVQVAKHCKHIDAFDLAPKLIEAAGETAKREGVDNVSFRVGDVREVLKPGQQYDHVLCMGLFTAIPDQRIFEDTVRLLPRLMASGGYLLLKDSMSLGEEELLIKDDYAAIYRNEAEYLGAFQKAGFSLRSQADLAMSFNKRQVSKLFLLRKD